MLTCLSWQLNLCLNYVQGGYCLIDRRPCLLGPRGVEARNEDHGCARHGPFDVWRTREDLILISDLGGPYDGVKDCYGLGISLEEATRVAREFAESSRARIVTTQGKCEKCGTRFWPRAGLTDSNMRGRALGYFCPSCLKDASEAELDEYWKEIGSSQHTEHVNLSDWCG